MRQRGFSYIKAFLALGALLAIAVCIVAIRGYLNDIEARGHKLGKAEVQAAWDEANRAAQAEERRKRLEREGIVAEQQTLLEALNLTAAYWEQQWKEARNAQRRNKTPMVVCPASTDVAASGASGAVAGPALEPRLTVGFVRLYDTAWTGTDGKPLFGDPAAGEAAGAGAASPYGADELLDTHQENARRANICRRDLNSLMDTIERLQGIRR